MVDVVITYETLFDILRKEKSRQELQQLPPDFFAQVGGYLGRKRVDVDAAGGPASPAAQKPLIQYRNVQRILRELYERRERKILEMALNRARTESNIIDMTPLLNQERPFFEECARVLKLFRRELLETLMSGDLPPPDPSFSSADPEAPVVPSDDDVVAVPPPRSGADDAGAPRGDVPSGRDVLPGRDVPSGRDAPAGRDASLSVADLSSRERCPVRFIAGVPKFLGLHGEIHGPFESGDRAELPGRIAAVLLKKKRVELA